MRRLIRSSLIRSPLSWMVVAEVAVVTLLVIVAWQLVTGVAHTRGAVPAVAAPAPSAAPLDPAALGLPDVDIPIVAPAQGAMPGLNLASAFWRARLVDLNRDEGLFVQLEWRLVRAAEAAVKRYIDTVVLPAVRRAERTRR
jgi:hypothetical protein